MRYLLIFLISASAMSCSKSGKTSLEGEREGRARWYSEQQVSIGSVLFEQNCSECHGSRAQGKVANWKQKLADGSFPPPPLNGSAHTWHHANSVLLQVINEGGKAFGGKMPAFQHVLDKEEKLAVIAYFQNFWEDEIYSQWEVMGGTR